MFTKSKTAKVFAGIVGLAIALAFVVTPVATKAATAAELTAQINALLAQIQLLQGQVGGSTTGGSSYVYNTDLTIGSTGSDVVALQTKLQEAGFLTMPSGVAKGYFGSLTASGVKSWQASAGLPSTGFFGPLSRAKANATWGGSTTGGTTGGTNTTPGCASGAAFNSVTGAPCTPSSTVPGCAAGAMFSATTGAPCTTTTPGVGTEGSITTLLSATPPNNANVRFTNDVPVWGTDVTAVGSDMIVDRADLQVAVTPVGGSAQNPSTFINTIKAWQGTTLLQTWSVNSSTFSKDSSDRYHVILSGLGVNVPKGTMKTVSFSFSVNSISNTDVNRTITVQGYAGNTQNIRATDSLGFQSYSDMSGSSNTRTHTFKPAGSSTLTVSLNSSLTPATGVALLNTTNGVIKKVMQAFSAKSESGDSKITKIYVAVHATSTTGLPSTIYLCNGSDTTCASPLGSVSAATTENGEALFNSLALSIPQDTTSSFLIAADFPSTAGGQMASTSMAANSVKWDQPDGSSASTTPGSAIAGNDQFFASAVPEWSMISQSNTLSSGGFAGASSTLTGKITLRVKANGGSLTRPTASNFSVVFASSTQSNSANYSSANSISITPTVTITENSSLATIGDGGYYTVEVTGILSSNNTSFGTAGGGQSYAEFMAIKDVDSTIGGFTITDQTFGGVSNWFTTSQVLTKV